MKKPKLRACRECGCTEQRACPPGCYWVAPDLCSACMAVVVPLSGREVKVMALVSECFASEWGVSSTDEDLQVAARMWGLWQGLLPRPARRRRKRARKGGRK